MQMRFYKKYPEPKIYSDDYKITWAQKKFINELFLCGFQPTKAAMITRGFRDKKRTASRWAQRTLRYPHVQREIRRRFRKVEITADRVLKELACIAFSNIQNIFNQDGSIKPVSEMDEDTTRALKALEIIASKEGLNKKVAFHNKLEALKILSQYTGILENKTKVEIENIDKLILAARERAQNGNTDGGQEDS